MSKIIQVAVTGVEENQATQCEFIIVALTDDGEVLTINNREIINSRPWRTVSPPKNKGENNGL